jgi:hypothetical protein
MSTSTHTAAGLNCQACGGEHTMKPGKISKMSQVVQLIGWIITIPSLLGILFAVFIFLSGVLATGTTENPDAAGASLVVGTGTALCFGISSLLSGLVGYLLIMKKKVWKCTQCGYHIDRD